ncbi:MAG: hypothetical protein B7X34_02245 [Acidobacteriia bacterium 12-62-4]|nr:MAG: hypothetical protein B7X34_02245 [Acidobacteriia bacterium 12-62-4]
MVVEFTLDYKLIGWSQTTNGNPYISQVDETMDPGHADSKLRRTAQEINELGNITWRKEYAFGSTSVIARQFTYNYVTASNYLTKHIRNLVSSVVLSRPGTSVTVVENTYDQYTNQSGCVVGSLADMPGATLHDATNYGPLHSLRGNVTRAVSLATTR